MFRSGLLTGQPNDDGSTDVVSYADVLSRAASVAQHLSKYRDSVDSRFVANMCVPGWEYIACMWGTWASGYASVPLSLSQKASELEHVLDDTKPLAILVGGGISLDGSDFQTQRPPNLNELVHAAEKVAVQNRLVPLADILSNGSSTPNAFSLGDRGVVKDMDCPALVLYTSGTTGKPKGVVSTHQNIFHQVTDLMSSWKWQSTDVALHVLPLHHVHGVVNVLSCAAYAGAQLEFRPFDARELWWHWAEPASALPIPRPSVFMAVPTIYAKLLEVAEALPDKEVQEAVDSTLQPMRLMVSGSASLPVSLLERWRTLTGHTLLERYGMTEFGMALSNPYEPSSERQPGHVGRPLPSVKIRSRDRENYLADAENPSTSGELLVRGPTVFQEYLNRKDAFDEDGYFRTGDVAEFNRELNSYRILGRASVDILKSGG